MVKQEEVDNKDELSGGDLLSRHFESIDLTGVPGYNTEIELGQKFKPQLSPEVTEDKVYLCISCGRYKIDFQKPYECPCNRPNFVVDLTKRIE